MKKLVAFTLVLLLILSVCACNNQVPSNNDGQSQNNENQSSQPTGTQPQTDNQPPQEFVFAKPETNLEFWIAENVDNVDFSKYQEKYGKVVRRIVTPAIELSSTDVRAAVAEGFPIEGAVPPAVADYIHTHGLYRNA